MMSEGRVAGSDVKQVSSDQITGEGLTQGKKLGFYSNFYKKLLQSYQQESNMALMITL